jgi:hypothetical protein
MTHPTKFSIIGAQVATPNWTGVPITLAWHDTATMPQPPNGSTVLAWLNTATQNNDGSLAAVSGATQPQFLDAPALATVPSILVQNWEGNNLNLTNISANKATPIWVEMFGPGLGGVTPVTLTANAPAPIALASGGAAVGSSPSNLAQLILQSNTSNLTIVTLIGGPATGTPTKNNAYVFALNCPSNPGGYTKTTTGNSMTYQFTWNTSFFIANMSPSTSAAVNVSLLSL